MIRLLFFLLIFSDVLSAFAQEYKPDTRYPGYFINAKNDTIRGFILLKNKLDNQKIGVYSNDAKGEKIKIQLLPDEVHGYKFQDRVYTAVLYGEPDPLMYHFLLTLDEGYLKLYQYFYLSHDLYVKDGRGDHAATGYDEQYLQFEYVVVKKDQTQVIITNQNSLQKNAKALFGDDPEIMKKISDKEKGYHYTDFPGMVKEYNDWKAKQ